MTACGPPRRRSTRICTPIPSFPTRSTGRTAGQVAQQLQEYGLTVQTGIGGTGVVGLLANGDGPTVLLRAELDALPVKEDTGAPYASTVTVKDADGHEIFHAIAPVRDSLAVSRRRNGWAARGKGIRPAGHRAA